VKPKLDLMARKRLNDLKAEALKAERKIPKAPTRRGQPKRVKLSKAIARREEIRRLWSEGWQARPLAARFDLSPSQISAITKGLPRPLRGRGDENERAPIILPPMIPDPARSPAPRPRYERTGPVEPGDQLGAIGVSLGSAHGQAKLTEAKVARMKRYRLEGASTGKLAKLFGVSRANVCSIVNGQTWKHVEPLPRGPITQSRPIGGES
jgi:hypothetical protein